MFVIQPGHWPLPHMYDSKPALHGCHIVATYRTSVGGTESHREYVLREGGGGDKKCFRHRKASCLISPCLRVVPCARAICLFHCRNKVIGA